MDAFEKQLLLEVLDTAYHQFASETCDDVEFEYSQEMYDFLVKMYKYYEPEEDTTPDIYNNTLVTSFSGIIYYLRELVKNTV